MIRQNSILMAKLTNPDILIDIQMSRYGTFDFDKSEKLIAIGRQKTSQAIDKYPSHTFGIP
jgi:NTE family protein